MVVIQDIFPLPHPLLIYLQKVNVAQAFAMDTANNLNNLIKDVHSNV